MPGRLPFVGRRRELDLLIEAQEEARAGVGHTILLEGEAGLGKSRLMEEFRGLVEANGRLCLRGRCSFRGGRNFEPFVEALEEFARCSRDDGADEVAGAGGTRAVPGALFSTLNMLLDPSTRLEPHSREQLWYLIDSLLKHIAEREPLVLMLDDLHWADEGTLSLLSHVTRNLSGSRLLLVGSFRPEELRGTGEHPLEDLIRMLSTVSTFARVALEPLNRRETEALVGAVFADPGLGQAMSPTLHKRAQGNPFFTIEILRLLGGEKSGPNGGAPTVPDTVMLPQTVAGSAIAWAVGSVSLGSTSRTAGSRTTTT